MNRLSLSLITVVALATTFGVACSKDKNNDNPDLAHVDAAGGGKDMAVPGGDMAVTIDDMAMRASGTGQVIIAEVQGTAYAPTPGTDGGVSAIQGVHAIAAIAQFEQFQPIIGTNDENTLNFAAFPQPGCLVQTFVPASGDVPESQISAGLVSAATVNGNQLGIAPAGGITSPALTPANGLAIDCALASVSGLKVYGCAFTAEDSDMAANPWQNQATGGAAFPTVMDDTFVPFGLPDHTCLPPNYAHVGPYCVPTLIGSTLNVSVAGDSTTGYNTKTAKPAIAVPSEVTITGIALGTTELTLPVAAGTLPIEAIDGNLTADADLKVSFTCGADCQAPSSVDIGLVGLLAQTSTNKRGEPVDPNAKFAVAECVAPADATGSITMKASQVAKLRAAAAGGSIQFTLARINANLTVGGGATSLPVVTGAGRGQFVYVNQ